MHETLRMLGEQHEADLAREAARAHLATTARSVWSPSSSSPTRNDKGWVWTVFRAGLAGLMRSAQTAKSK
jgi:hypothetical protein